MTGEVSRRTWMRGALALAGGAWLVPQALLAEDSGFEAAVRRLEAESGGRLGVCFHNGRNGKVQGHRAAERFPMCSTFKMLCAAAVLHRVDRHEESLERRVRFTRRQILAYSPVMEKHAGGSGMNMRELCAAAVTESDNTAANLMLESLGGPAGYTAYARSLGDTLTTLDRTEPAMNEVLPGEMHDTTTPEAMLNDLRCVVLGDALSEASRALLTDWLIHCETGHERIRAGLPRAWRVGDKTGTGIRGTSNDIAVFWDDEGRASLLTVYLTEAKGTGDERNAIIARVAAAAVAEMQGGARR